MKHTNELASFQRSNLQVFLFTVLTVGLYSYYWFYRQWKAVGIRTEKDTNPVLGAIFDFITAFKLFSQLLPGQMISAVILATIYLVLFVVGLFFDAGEDNLLMTMAIKFITLIALAGVITTVHHYALLESRIQKKTPFLPGEIVVIVIGCYLALISLVPLVFAPQSVVNERFATLEVSMKKTSAEAEVAQSKQMKCLDEFNTLREKVDANDPAATNAYDTKKAECNRLGDETFELVKELTSYVPKYLYAMIR